MIATALLLAAFPSLPLSATPASASIPTCRGQEATHTGDPGKPLVTTPGPDVVITNGASEVRTLNGDDVICATRLRFVYIVPGGGDDLVDATRYRGDNLQTTLGQYGVDGSSGDDTYLGGDQTDQVFVSSGAATDHKQIHTDGGKDYLNIDRDYLGDVTAKLGKAPDDYWNDRPRAGVVVDAEEGPDQFNTECLGCDFAGFYLEHGKVVINDRPGGRAIGFQALDVINFGTRVLPHVAVFGTEAADRISVTACHGVIRGKGGNDSLSLSVRPRPAHCARIGAIIYGGTGDDTMIGSNGVDTLRGGLGHDEAYGEGGRDLCRAEIRDECER